MLICLGLDVFASLMLNHTMHCTILICLIYPLDHVHAKPKAEIQVARILTFALDQGKPWCI
jgi:hypothetical protein